MAEIGLVPQLQNLAQDFIQKEAKAVQTAAKAITGVNGLKIPSVSSLQKLLGSLPTGISTIQSTVQSFTSAGQSLDKANGLGGFLNSAIGSAQTLAGAVTSVVGAAGSLGIDVSALGGLSQKILGVNNFVGSKATANPFTMTPRFQFEKKVSNQGLTYPLDLDSFDNMERIQIGISAYEKVNMTQKANYNKEEDIFLPLPKDLVESYSPLWSEYSPGPIRGMLEDFIKTAKRTEKGDLDYDSLSSSLNEEYNRLKSNYENSSPDERAAAIGTIGQIGLYYTTGPNSDVSNLAGNFTGRTVNPYTTVAFQGVGLRQHNFFWMFAPKTQQESERLFEIFKKLRKAALPQVQNNYFLEYPSVINLKFLPDESKLYNFKRCIINNITINHAGSGTPSFFSEGGAPTIYAMALSLKEIEIYNGNDIGVSSENTTSANGSIFGKTSSGSDEEKIIVPKTPSGTRGTLGS